MTERIYLNVGCGRVKLPGFVNVDLIPEADLRLDVRQGLPFADDSVHGIYSEHFIEHLGQAEAVGFLRECRRVLVPGGVLRVATPDLDRVVEEYVSGEWRQPWMDKYGYAWIRTRAEALNVQMREWGHKWLFNEEELRRLGEFAGLERATRHALNASQDAMLAGRETRAESSLILEFVKPAGQLSGEPLVSIVMPAYKPAFFAEALQSAVRQSYANIEILVLDDSPGEEIEAIVRALPGRPIRYLRNDPRLGEIRSLTRGIEEARGELIKPLYDDDVLETDCVRSLVEALRKCPRAVLASSRRQLIDSEGNPLLDASFSVPLTAFDSEIDGVSLADEILRTNTNRIGEPSTVLFRRSDALSIRPVVMSFSGLPVEGCGDVALYLNLLSRGNVVYLARTLSRFRLHAGQIQRDPETHAKGLAGWSFLRTHAERLGLYRPQAPGRLRLRSPGEKTWQRHADLDAAGAGLPAHLRVLAYSRDVRTSSCAQIRLLRPMRHLQPQWELIWANEAGRAGLGVLVESLLKDADLIVLQRSFPGADTASLLETIFASGKPVVYETDDLLTELPEDNPHHAEFAPHKPYIEDAMRRADALLVSTPGLARRLAAFNGRVRVLPNLLDYDLFYRPLPDNGRRIHIAVAGTSARAGDFKLIDAALRAICAEYGARIRIKFIGAMPESWVGHANAEAVPFTPDYGGYAARMKSLDLDIGLAPLQDNPFNACKSAIKWMEFSALGMAGIYSHVPAYREVIKQGKTGLLVDNKTEKWITALKLLIDNPDYRREIALSAQLEVYREHSLQKRAGLVHETYRGLLLEFAAQGKGRAATTGEGAAPPAAGGLDYYALWQVGHAYQEWDLRWIGERMAAWNAPPSVRLGVICRAGREDMLANNLKSLSAQFHAGWHLTVVAETEAPAGLAELSRVSWHQVPADAAISALNTALLESTEEWVGMLEAGDRLPAHATFAIADAVMRHPEWRMLYSDEDRLAADGTRHTPFFKPDFDADMLRCAPFSLGGLVLLRRDLFAGLGGMRPQAEGVLTWDLALRASERLSEGEVGHLADVLYHRHEEGGHCLRAPEEAWQVAAGCLREHLDRLGWPAEVEEGRLPGSFRIRYRVLGQPLVSIIIPTKNKVDLLRNCLTSLIEGTGYSRCEVLVVDNGSDDPATLAYLQALRELGSAHLKVLSFPGPFNFSAMNNFAARQARGDYLLLLNNDTRVLHEDWLEEMLGYAQRADVGAVGARLLYPDGSIQHAGAILGLGGMGSNHVFSRAAGDDPGYYGRLMLPQAYSAVTAACLLTRKAVYEAVGGLDEETFQVNFNDVDYCLKLRARGLKVIWTPHATLVHEESVSQAAADVELLAREEKYKRLYREVEAVVAKWPHWFANDPAYNRNLSLIQPFQPEPTPALTWDPEWRPAPRVLSIHADAMGCGEYRISAPMRALTRAGKVMGWDAAGYFHPREYARMDPESIVFQRQLEWGQIEFMQRIARISKAFRVYELDDLITNIPIMSSQKKLFVEQKDVVKRFRKAVSLCHRFVVSTAYLAEAFRGYCEDIVVVPNYLERARWDGYRPLRRGGGKARVGWAGSSTHAGDLRLIVDVVKATADEVDWIFFGMCPDAIRPLVKEFHEPVKLDDYPAKLASLDLDLAIAPLEDIPFNHGKSHLRLLEYGVMGYPVVCSDITPYRGAFPVTRVPAKFKAWVEAIRERVADRDALAREGDALREHVQRHWMLEDHLDVWLRAWLPPSSSFSGRSR